MLRNGNNSKKILALLFLMLFLIFYTSCAPGLYDWGYELPKGYEISHINAGTIQLLDDSGRIIIDNYIYAFCYNEEYIGVQRIPREFGDLDVDAEIDICEIDYYLMDISDDVLFGDYRIWGEFTLEEYNQKIEDLCIKDLCDWIFTVPAPDGADYD